VNTAVKPSQICETDKIVLCFCYESMIDKMVTEKNQE